MSVTDSLLAEFEQESKTTRRVLERVPENRLTWKPHPKSMSVGTLALHCAMSPGYIAGNWAVLDKVEMSPGGGGTPEPKTVAEILAAHDESVQKTKDALTSIGDEGMMKDWKMTTKEGATIMGMPKASLIRAIVLNHLYHHRGQLSVYLRLLDVPVPSIYGPSADENPFAART